MAQRGVTGSEVSEEGAAAACPICGKPSLDAFRPFCSRRCGDVDLNRWLSGVYAIPVRETDDDPDRPHDPDGEAEQ